MHPCRRETAGIAARVRRLLHSLCAVLVLAVGLFLGAVPASAELKAIDVTNELERLDILPLGELQEAGDQVTVKTVPGKEGVTEPWTADASTPGTKPGWFAFALRNPTDKQVERWLVVDRYNPAVSGIIM